MSAGLQPDELCDERVERDEILAVVHSELLLLLTPAQRQVIEATLADRPLAETAAALGTSVGAVKGLKHRALEALRELAERPRPPRVSVDHERAWSDDDVARLRLGVAQGWTDAEIAGWLDRTQNAIKVRRNRLGLRRAAVTTVGSDRHTSSIP